MNKQIRKWYDTMLSRCLAFWGFTSCAGLISCQIEYGSPSDYLSVHPEELNFPAEGGSVSIAVSSEGKWNVTSIPSFVHATPTKGNGSEQITIVAQENKNETSRYGLLEIYGDETVTVTIYQAGR